MHGECTPSRSHIYVARLRDDGALSAVPVTCRQCEDALCVTMCPAEALGCTNSDGTVIVDESRCIGCRTCVEVCPLGAPAVDPRLGTSQKCTLCDGDPVCVKVCAERALTFTDADEEGPRRKRATLEAYLEAVASPAAPGGVARGAGPRR
jgi:Fe-S-cluster-containing dehydrogenase component